MTRLLGVAVVLAAVLGIAGPASAAPHRSVRTGVVIDGSETGRIIVDGSDTVRRGA